MERLAVVVPCYNEEEMLPITVRTLTDVLDNLIGKNKVSQDSFILFVDDGSKDKTWEKIEEEHSKNNKVYGLKLTGNAGHQYALTAGLLSAKDLCEVTISIDADLQDDVTVMEEMIDKFHGGKDIVYGVRNKRKNDSFFKRTTAQGFYKMLSFMGVKTIYNHADYRLMSKRSIEYFGEFEESNLYLRGIMPYMNFPSDSVYYERKDRVAGESKYPLKKMLALAFNGITSFSIKPISLITFMGSSIVLLTCFAAIYALFSYFTGNVVAGWTSLILSIWFIGGVQLLSIGLIGQYIGKIYMEVKHRPRYHIDKLLKHK
ncbi:MAG TPA: glycosyltransferase family 2 protein [Lachnospiraceae bacterium]|nr:glycosyltransferase family 2 protein [Lachnospiraceae bacterium]